MRDIQTKHTCTPRHTAGKKFDDTVGVSDWIAETATDKGRTASTENERDIARALRARGGVGSGHFGPTQGSAASREHVKASVERVINSANNPEHERRVAADRMRG